MISTFSWEQISQFIINLKADFDRQRQEQQAKAEGPFEPNIRKLASGTKLFTRQDLGGLLLDAEEAEKYRACARGLYSHVAGKTGQMSWDALEDAFQIAILRALNITSTDPETDFSIRLAREIEELKRTLKRTPETFVVRLQVEGLNQAQLPQRFGSFNFYVASQNTIPMPDDHHDTSDPERLKRIESNRVLRERLRANLTGKTFAEIELDAFDRNAAMSRAENKLRKTLDVLNYFGEFFSDAEARAFLPGEAIPARRITIIGRKSEPENNYFAFGNKGPLVPFSFPSGKSPSQSVEAFERASNLLASPNGSDLEERLVSALQWAGRACTDDRSDSAFLHSCISLETLLSTRQLSEITYAFALRTVHLLFRRDVRIEWLKKMKKYYHLRSGLAHSGTADVSDADLAIIRDIVRHSILSVLVIEPFCKMTKCEELDSWFDGQLLAGNSGDSDSNELQLDAAEVGSNGNL